METHIRRTWGWRRPEWVWIIHPSTLWRPARRMIDWLREGDKREVETVRDSVRWAWRWTNPWQRLKNMVAYVALFPWSGVAVAVLVGSVVAYLTRLAWALLSMACLVIARIAHLLPWQIQVTHPAGVATWEVTGWRASRAQMRDTSWRLPGAPRAPTGV